MNIVIRVDASVWIGSGHVMRCLVLADSLKNHGYLIRFACLKQTGDMVSFIRERGYNVIELTSPEQLQVPRSDSDYEAWLQRPQKTDALDFVMCVQYADLVITDHYGIGRLWHEIIKTHLCCNIVAIDDLVREHCADLIVDQTLGRLPAIYQTQGIVLAGTKYALLNEKFATARIQAEKRKFNLDKIKILISMGGIDRPNATLSVLHSLVGHVDAIFTVLLSQRSPHFQQVSEWCSMSPEVNHIEFVDDMAQMMLDHDISIGAPGSTSWERACLGLPSIIIPLADNQKEISKQLVKHGVAIEIKLDNIENELFDAFKLLCENWHLFSRRSLACCDGKGTERVVNEIIRLNNESCYNL